LVPAQRKVLSNSATGWGDAYADDRYCRIQYQGAVVKVPYVEHVPPDVAAAKFWLLNRRRAQWSDASRHGLTGANGGEIEISQCSDLDRARRIAYILSQPAAIKGEP
jgi:hypothetical protein